MKPITEFFFTENYIDSNESSFWFSDYKKEVFVMHSEVEFRENIVIISSASESSSYGEFLLQRSSFTYTTIRDYEKIDSILSYMGGFIQMILFVSHFIMGYYNSQNLKLRLANELYQFEEPKKLTHQDKELSKFKSRQSFLENAFEKLNKKPKNLTLSPSYFLFILSFQKLFTSEENQLVNEAMKQVDKDLNMFEILVRLHEVDKMKQIIFTEGQRKVLEYSDKPSINLETIYKNKIIEDIHNQDIKRQKLMKQKQNKVLKQDRKGFCMKLKLLFQKQNNNNLQTSLNELKRYQSTQQTQMQSFAYCKNLNNFQEVAQLAQYLNQQLNWKRVQTISALLVDEYSFKNNFMRINDTPSLQPQKQILNDGNQSIQSEAAMNFPINSMNLQRVKQSKNSFCLSSTSKLINLSIQDNTENQVQVPQSLRTKQQSLVFQAINQSTTKLEGENDLSISRNQKENSKSYNKKKLLADDSDSDSELSPLQLFLKQNKKKNGLLLTLIKQLRPTTFYTLRMDYSKFSSFYELFQVCEETIFSKKNKSQLKLTQKVIGFLRQDILDAFRLAKQLPSLEEIEKKKKINFLVKVFVSNLKKVIERTSQNSQECKLADEKEEGDQKDILLKYSIQFNQMNYLNDKNIQRKKSFHSLSTHNFVDPENNNTIRGSQTNRNDSSNAHQIQYSNSFRQRQDDHEDSLKDFENNLASNGDIIENFFKKKQQSLNHQQVKIIKSPILSNDKPRKTLSPKSKLKKKEIKFRNQSKSFVQPLDSIGNKLKKFPSQASIFGPPFKKNSSVEDLEDQIQFNPNKEKKDEETSINLQNIKIQSKESESQNESLTRITQLKEIVIWDNKGFSQFDLQNNKLNIDQNL